MKIIAIAHVKELNPFTPKSAIWHSKIDTCLKNHNYLKQAKLGSFTISHQALINYSNSNAERFRNNQQFVQKLSLKLEQSRKLLFWSQIWKTKITLFGPHSFWSNHRFEAANEHSQQSLGLALYYRKVFSWFGDSQAELQPLDYDHLASTCFFSFYCRKACREITYHAVSDVTSPHLYGKI